MRNLKDEVARLIADRRREATLGILLEELELVTEALQDGGDHADHWRSRLTRVTTALMAFGSDVH